MSLSRHVFSSPFDIPAKPRVSNNANTHGRRTTIKSRNRGTSLGRCVRNIMTDSRVVRRSSFNPPLRNHNNFQVGDDQSNRGQYIMFDCRLLQKNESVFASPIVTVIEVDHVKKTINDNQSIAPVNVSSSVVYSPWIPFFPLSYSYHDHMLTIVNVIEIIAEDARQNADCKESTP